jgi:hypothetical protein
MKRIAVTFKSAPEVIRSGTFWATLCRLLMEVVSFPLRRGGHYIDGKWDLLIAHPPCTYLTSAGTRHYSLRMNPPEKVVARINERDKAKLFFMALANADCDRIAVENPVGYMNTHYRKPDQIIHPYYFATSTEDKENYVQKRTCLWLKGLPLLERTSDLPKPEPAYICQGEKCKGKAIRWCEGIKGTHGGQAGRAKARSKTFEGFAKAMAEQWGNEEVQHIDPKVQKGDDAL